MVAGESTINNAKLRLKLAAGSGTVVLHPLLRGNLAGATARLNDVMDRTIICGQTTAVAGETADVVLTQECRTKLLSGVWYGVGVYDKDVSAEYDTSATLIINDT